MEMYESPISTHQMVESKIRESVDGTIYEAVLKTDVHVDRDELIRALRYDRDQYAKGYADGKRDAERHGRWVEWWPSSCALILTGEEMLWECSRCTAKFDSKENMHYCPNCGAKMDEECGND